MFTLSKKNLKTLSQNGVSVPDELLFQLPEKVLQFGTGVLLRGLPDLLIDNANQQGVFNGRVVIVKSTVTGSVSDFDEQDSLYTIHVNGIDNGQLVSEAIVCSSVSRVLSAVTDWNEILQVGCDPSLQVILSNTTEVGIQLVEEAIDGRVPDSFPGKLLAVLYERFKVLGGTVASGLVIVPTELIVDNGQKLKAIMLELAGINKLETEFIDWLINSNYFCDSLVDRIVPGKPPVVRLAELEDSSGYKDALRIVAEPYYLWAIKGDGHIRNILSFSKVNAGMVIDDDIELYRELKLRLLNGTHTLSCAVAILAGFTNVKEAMDNSVFLNFVEEMMDRDIAPAIPYPVQPAATHEFSRQVLDRFRNPGIEHRWLSISAQYSLKLKMRVVPLLLNHYRVSSTIPIYIVTGFAAFIRLMKVYPSENGYYGQIDKFIYELKDDNLLFFYEAWLSEDPEMVVHTVLANAELWGADLTLLPGFKIAVVTMLERIRSLGILAVLQDI